MSSQDEKKNDEEQETCRHILNAFKQEGGSIAYALSQYKQILTRYQQNNTYDDEFRDYILNHFLAQSCIYLMKRQYNYSPAELHTADLINECCRLLISIAVPLMESDSEVGMTLIYHCLSPLNSPFHRIFGHDFREKRGSELSESEQDELDEWRASELAIGAHVDYLMSNRWRYGVIKEMKPKQDAANSTLLYIQPLMHGIPAQHIGSDGDVDEDILQSSDAFTLSAATFSQLCKPLTKSIEQRPHMTEWRKRLRAKKEEDAEHQGDALWRCDYLDTVHKWYTCLIYEDEPAANRMKINYDGWSHRYDDWIYRDAMQLQPLLTKAKGGRESQGVQGTVDELEPCLEDEEDPEFKEGADAVYAVWRGRLNQIGFHVIDLLNEFGRCGGFDAVMNRLRNRKPTIPMRILRFVLAPLSHCFKCYTRGFADKFILPITELVFEILESLTENEIKDLSKDYLERIVQALERLLMRYKTREEIAERVETFQLKMALKRLKCVNLDRRVEGAQYVADVCSRTHRSGFGHSYSQYSGKWVNAQYLYRWIEDNGLLYLCYGPSHGMLQRNGALIEGFIRIYFTETADETEQRRSQLPIDVINLIKLWYNEQSNASIMKQSVDVLKFIATESQFSLHHLEILWNVVERYSVSYRSQKHKKRKQDEEEEEKDEGEDTELSTICEVIESLMYYLDVDHINFLVDKIEQMDVSLITEHHLSVISSASKSYADDQMAAKCLQFLWKLVQDDGDSQSARDQPHAQLVERAMFALCRDLGSKAGETLRWQFVQKCLTDLREHRNACKALYSLRTLLSFMDEEDRSLMIAHLIDNEKFVHAYLEELTHFKQSQLPKLKEKEKEKEQELHLTQKTYLDEVKERIKFLRFLFKHYAHITLSEEQKDVLYAQFIVNAVSDEERKLAVRRFKGVVMMSEQNKDKYPLLSAYDNDNDEEQDEEDDEDSSDEDDGDEANVQPQRAHSGTEEEEEDGGAAAMQHILQMQQRQQQQNVNVSAAADEIDAEVLAALGDMDNEELLNQQLMLQYYQQQQQQQ